MSDFASQIVRYLDNEMSSDEAKAFEAIIAAEPEKLSELQAHQAARAAIFSVQQAEIKKQLQAKPPSRFKAWLLAIVILTAGLLLGLSFYKQSNLALVDQPLTDFCEEYDGAFRGADSPAKPDRIKVNFCELYHAGQYQSIINHYKNTTDSLPIRDPARMKLSYPIALTYAKLGDIQKAKELLLAIESNGYDYQPEAKKTLKALNSFWRW